MAKKVSTLNMSEPLGNLRSAEILIDPGDGNLVVDGSSRDGQALASGTLEYLEKNGLPTWSVDQSKLTPIFTIQAAHKGQSWAWLPWSKCNGATTWKIYLNRQIPVAVVAHSDGGNIALDLAGMPVGKVSAETGGGNIDLVLPEPATALEVMAKSGAGNVTVHVPEGVAVRFQGATGLGKLILSPRLAQVDKDSYQTADYEQAGQKINLVLNSGMGNIVVGEQKIG